MRTSQGNSECRAAVLAAMEVYGLLHLNEPFEHSEWLHADGERLYYAVPGFEVHGNVAAPLWFVVSAWAALFAHQQRPGYVIDGKLNRQWYWRRANMPTPSRILDHSVRAAFRRVVSFRADGLWSVEVYGIRNEAPFHTLPRSRSRAGMPSRTSITGALKRVLKTAADPDPAERLAVVEFLAHAVVSEWVYTEGPRMMGVIGPALHAFLGDSEPAVRELALLAADHTAWELWRLHEHALYAPLCEQLILAGIEVDLNHALLAEAAYVHGNTERGDRHLTLARQGQDRWVSTEGWGQSCGCMSHFIARVLRRAAWAQLCLANGRKISGVLDKVGDARNSVDVVTQAHLIQCCERLLQQAATYQGPRRAAASADLSQDEFDASIENETKTGAFERAAIHAERARLLNQPIEQLTALLDACVNPQGGLGVPKVSWQRQAVVLAATLDESQLQQVNFPERLRTDLSHRRRDLVLFHQVTGRESLFWRDLFTQVSKLLWNKDEHDRDVEAATFEVQRRGTQLICSHPKLEADMTGPLLAPITLALQVWDRLLSRTEGKGTQLEWTGSRYVLVLLSPDSLAVIEQIAADCEAQNLDVEALRYRRIALQLDPLIKIAGAPTAPRPQAAAERLLERSQRITDIAKAQYYAKDKPRLKRLSHLAGDLARAPDDIDIAHDVAVGLMQAFESSAESDFVKAFKIGEPLILALCQHVDASVREIAVFAISNLLRMSSVAANSCYIFPGDIDFSEAKSMLRDLAISTGGL